MEKCRDDVIAVIPTLRLGFKGRNRARTGGLRVRGQGSGSTRREPSIGSGPPGTGREINPFLRVRHDWGCDESRTVNTTVSATKSINPKDLGAFSAPHGSRLVAREGVGKKVEVDPNRQHGDRFVEHARTMHRSRSTRSALRRCAVTDYDFCASLNS